MTRAEPLSNGSSTRNLLGSDQFDMSSTSNFLIQNEARMLRLKKKLWGQTLSQTGSYWIIPKSMFKLIP